MRDAEGKNSKFRVIIDFLQWLIGKRPAQPGDPYAYVMAPVRPGPKGRSGAAVTEIEEDSFRIFPPRR